MELFDAIRIIGLLDVK